MSKEKFNWKSLFVNEEEGSNTGSTQEKKTSFPKETSSTKFPEQEISTTSITSSSTPPPLNVGKINNSTLDTVINMYEAGFDSLNMPGYDFYEFFKAIKAVNSNDASVYKMAMTMAQSVDSKVDKAALLKGGEYYINEIDKVHKQYATKGNAKRDQIQNNQLKEKEQLSSEISTLEKQIMELQTKVSEKKIKLESADSSLLNDISDIEQKIAANDMAKAKIQETITSVINGIKNNL